MHPIVIIGSGMAAYAVAREFRKLNPEQDVLMICADDGVNYAKPTLSNAFTAKKAPEQIALADAAKMSAQLNIRIQPQIRVHAIDSHAQQLSLEHAGTRSVQPYEKLVLALGAEPIRLNISGDAQDDIMVVNHLDHYQAFRKQLDEREAKRIVILGAGLIGCEFANDLQNNGYDTTVIDLAPQVLGRLLPNQVATTYQDKLEAVGIQFVLNTTVDRIEKTQSSYSVTLANGQCLEADAVLSAVGLKPNTELAQQAGIHTQRGIVTNTELATNVANIYAVGDCAEVDGHLLPYVMPIMQQARALAKTLNGDVNAVHYPAMPVAVKTPAAPLTVLPVAAELDVTWQIEGLEDGLIAKAVDTNSTLRGFVLLGATASKQRLTLTKLVPDLIPVTVQD